MQKMVTETADTLNALLRGELSAVETYQQALTKITDPKFRPTLDENLHQHQMRVDLLRTRIRELGGKPAESSGAWGAFAKLVEGGAKLLGDKTAIAALEEGEDHGLKDYRDACTKLDPSTRQFCEGQLLSGQEQTHRAMSTIKKLVH